jgi:hypothetical protein
VQPGGQLEVGIGGESVGRLHPVGAPDASHAGVLRLRQVQSERANKVESLQIILARFVAGARSIQLHIIVLALCASNKQKKTFNFCKAARERSNAPL